ncbi:hypothetical protein AOLI_G00281050 [Acnodon oligacanthus]
MQQLNCSSSSQLTSVFPVSIASSAVLGLCFVLGVPGNISVLGILVRRLKENSFTIRLMLSLAVSDLLILLPLPVWIWAFLHDWIFGSVACSAISYVEYWCIYCSALCVTLMSFQSSQLTDAFPVCIASSVVMGLSFVMEIHGNLSVLRTLVRRLKENSFTIMLMLSLAISDLLNLLPLPMWIWAHLHD